MKPNTLVLKRAVQCLLFFLALGMKTPTQAVPPQYNPSTFQYRGIVEGFYGPSWTHQDRLEILRFMGQVGMNVYFYAPKEDRYHRDKWRESYPDDQLKRFKVLLESARKNQVDFYYAISPGVSMVYSDAREHQALQRKIQAMQSLGVEHFALFLDDLPPTLQHETDQQEFASLAHAHVDLINRVYLYLGTGANSLVVCPTTYTNAWGDREYLRILGTAVPKEVLFFWTGIDVVSPEINREQAEEWGKLMSRKPLIWDNLPVNDYARWRPFLGALKFRASDLAEATLGIISNPMSESHASMIPLATVADYARNPTGYNPQRSLQTALKKLYGKEAFVHLQTFAEIYGDYGWDHNVFEPLFVPGLPLHLPRIKEALARLKRAMEGLKRPFLAQSDRLRKLTEELEPFLIRTTARWLDLQSDLGSGLKNRVGTYPNKTFRTHRAAVPVHVDGDLSEWRQEKFYNLEGGPGREKDNVARVALLWDDGHLYVAVEVRSELTDLPKGESLSKGDHLALILVRQPADPDNCLKPEDLVILVAPPRDKRQPQKLVLSMHLEGFMAKYMAGAHSLTTNSFIMAQFGFPPDPGDSCASQITCRSRKGATGYDTEISIPRMGRREFRFNLVVRAVDRVQGRKRSHTEMLSQKRYPANPTTFPRVLLVE